MLSAFPINNSIAAIKPWIIADPPPPSPSGAPSGEFRVKEKTILVPLSHVLLQTPPPPRQSPSGAPSGEFRVKENRILALHS